jgi:hypothetical protein
MKPGDVGTKRALLIAPGSSKSVVNAGAGAGGAGGSIDVGDLRALLDAAFDGRRPGRVG